VFEWIQQHYEWAAGLAVAIFTAILAWRELKKKEPAQIAVQDSSTSNSPIAAGKAINQNVNAPVINVNIPAPSPAVDVRHRSAPHQNITPQKARPNIVQTVIREINLTHDEQTDEWGAADDSFDGTVLAVAIRFTNEARIGTSNVGAFVRATLIYRNEADEERERISGCWLNEAYAATEFHVEGIRDLIAAFAGAASQLYAVANPRTTAARYSEDVTQVRELPGLQTGTLEVRLIDADSGEVLYTNHFTVTANPLKISSKKR
jgi:hypothetical protein